jgi:hypothetical protein
MKSSLKRRRKHEDGFVSRLAFRINSHHRDARTFCLYVQSFRVKECGDSALEEINSNGNACEIASRLNSFTVWLAAHGKSCSTIVKDVETRYRFYIDIARYKIDCLGVESMRSPDAPIWIIAYPPNYN